MSTAVWLGYSTSYFRFEGNFCFPSVKVLLWRHHTLWHLPLLTTASISWSSRCQSLPWKREEMRWTSGMLEWVVAVSRHRCSNAHSTVIVVWYSHPLFRYSYSWKQYPTKILYYTLLKHKYKYQPLDFIGEDVHTVLQPSAQSRRHTLRQFAQYFAPCPDTLITRKNWDFLINSICQKAVILSLLSLTQISKQCSLHFLAWNTWWLCPISEWWLLPDGYTANGTAMMIYYAILSLQLTETGTSFWNKTLLAVLGAS